eukprot:SAG11_NODE_653_length_7913_cov_86.345790_8_plen_50_part_00
MGKKRPSKKKIRSVIAQKKVYVEKHGKLPLAHKASTVAIHNSKRKNLTV